MGVTEDLLILYRDDHCVAVHKPPGLLVHPTALAAGEDDCALRRVRRQLGRRVFPVHRLDRATSGVLLFALGPEAARDLCLAFRQGEVGKTYRAVVRGWMPAEGRVDHPLRSLRGANARPAATEYRRLATAEVPVPTGRYPSARHSLVEVRPLTGRSHQIRRHFAHLSHPLVGDTVYGDGRHNRLWRERFEVHRLLLVATRLTFRPPGAADDVTVAAQEEPELEPPFRQLGWWPPPPG
ncbi:MAG: pseudouridine synthase [Deferrisomatales bacterium]